MSVTRASTGRDPDPASWYADAVPAVLSELDVDADVGLSASDIAARRSRWGANQLVSPPRRRPWLRFFDQFRSALSYVLIGAALLALLVGDLKDPIVIGVVLVLNAVLGFVQESRAEGALAALERMLSDQARVRREGRVEDVAAEDLVPGDIVLLEAGDRVPADGRIVFASRVSADESSLTGESTASEKSVDAIELPGDVAVSDRTNMLFMNTSVLTGRAEMVVTDVGMQTEIGRVAAMLGETTTDVTPLQRKIDRLGKRLAAIAAVAVVVVFALQLRQGESVSDAALAAVALAVAAIPEGLPAVVTVTLAVGVAQMAKRRAIVRRLPSVETLGSTTVICSDKTGTLTMNQMTTRAAVTRGRRINISGEGYDRRGRFSVVGATEPVDIEPLLRSAVLASDASVGRHDEVIGDPTEVALLVAALKAGIDIDELRARAPRVAEIPFDSGSKFMVAVTDGSPATAHMKGAPEAVLARCDSWLDELGASTELDESARRAQLEWARRLAEEGMRVLAIATRTHPGHDLGAEVPVDGYRLEGLLASIDPVRPEARRAVDLCRRAGIDVKMITGDHPTTAASIGQELGIRGNVVTGADLDDMTDDELGGRVEGIGVFARVAPEHKVRVISALQANGEVVAMTGDGVNDAPALRRADIGVAMGMTGTEVTKEAGDMVLADDNFATIVEAVRRGRTIYDNILSFVRFQLSTNVGAVVTMIAASVLGMPAPLAAMQLLWVNIIADGPPAMTLGLEPPNRDVMQRPPREPDAPIIDRRRLSAMALAGVTMAVGTLSVFHGAGERFDETTAQTMAFTTFVLMQLVNVMNVRSDTGSVFRRDTLRNGKLWLAVLVVAVLQVLANSWAPLQSVFDTTQLSLSQWLACLAVASSVLVVEEIRKLGARLRTNRTPSLDERANAIEFQPTSR
jgi:Ca2+-transporting ATPase